MKSRRHERKWKQKKVDRKANIKKEKKTLPKHEGI